MGMDIFLYQFTVDPKLAIEKEYEYDVRRTAMYRQMIEDHDLPEEYDIDGYWPEEYSEMYWDKNRELLDELTADFDWNDVRMKVQCPSPTDPNTWIGYFDSRYGEDPDIDDKILMVQYVSTFEWRWTGNFNRTLLAAVEEDLSDIFQVEEEEYKRAWVVPNWEDAYQRCYAMMMNICLVKDLDHHFPYWRKAEDIYRELRVVLKTIEFVLSKNKELQKMYALAWSY